ncbi:unnamed protein product [Urochloa humidicola]
MPPGRSIQISAGGSAPVGCAADPSDPSRRRGQAQQKNLPPVVMQSHWLSRCPFHTVSPRARGPALALSPPASSLPCARPRNCGEGTRCARPLRYRSREIGPGYHAAGRFQRRPSRSIAGTGCSGAISLRPGHHAPPQRRSEPSMATRATVGGPAYLIDLCFPPLETSQSAHALRRPPPPPPPPPAPCSWVSRPGREACISRVGGCAAVELGGMAGFFLSLVFSFLRVWLLNTVGRDKGGGGKLQGVPEIVPKIHLLLLFSFS